MIDLDRLNKPSQFIIDTDNSLINSIIGYWYCNEGNGGKIHDYGGNNNTCDVLSFPISNAWLNSRPSLDGINDRLEISNNVSMSPVNEFSFLIWCKVLGYPNRPDLFKSICAKTTSTAWNDGFGILSSPGSPRDLRFFVNHWDNNKAIISDFDVYLNEWVFIAGTYDRKNIKLYINGDLKDSFVYSSPVTTNIHALEIGRANNDNFCINMLVDQFIYFNNSLTAYEINDLYLNPYRLIQLDKRVKRILFKRKGKL